MVILLPGAGSGWIHRVITWRQRTPVSPFTAPAVLGAFSLSTALDCSLNHGPLGLAREVSELGKTKTLQSEVLCVCIYASNSALTERHTLLIVHLLLYYYLITSKNLLAFGKPVF